MKLHMEELYTHIFTLADKPVLDDIRAQFKEQRNLDWEAEKRLTWLIYREIYSVKGVS